MLDIYLIMNDNILDNAIEIVQIYEPFIVNEEVDTLLNIIDGLLLYIEEECGTVCTKEPEHIEQLRWCEYE